MQKWEYKVASADTQVLNQAGLEGWRVIGLVASTEGESLALIMRPLPGDPVEMTLTEFVEYGMWNTKSLAWVSDTSGRVISGSAGQMRATAQNIGWPELEVRPLPA